MAGTLSAITSQYRNLSGRPRTNDDHAVSDDDVMRALKLEIDLRLAADDPVRTATKPGKRFQPRCQNALKNTRKDILGTILLPMDGSVYVSSTRILHGRG